MLKSLHRSLECITLAKEINKLKHKTMTNSITLAELKDNNPNLNFIEIYFNKKYGWVDVDINNFNPSKTKKILGDVCTSFKGTTKKGKLLMPIVAISKIKARVKIWDKETMDNKTYKIKF